ncbi:MULTISPECIES: DUF308 domain-containing protein [Flammeovirga]|uniref:Uncharacterized protein n=1 Tax=Flammeovirga agarivorans TaxID=2726742 RepID=A0A7X8SJ62_9BACT|nr:MULTISPECIES: DUF308 domain-containing protein [Flammeovirga]NLR91150.1 hypothetical protein [Flammeovirga agarivorans]
MFKQSRFLSSSRNVISIVGISYLIIGTLLLVIPFSKEFSLTPIFASLLIPAGAIELYINTKYRDQIYSWGVSALNSLNDIFMGLALIIAAGNRLTLLYFTGFWLMIKAIYGLSYALQMKKASMLKHITFVVGIVVLFVAMFLVVNQLFPYDKVRSLIGLTMLLLGTHQLLGFKLDDIKNY